MLQGSVPTVPQWLPIEVTVVALVALASTVGIRALRGRPLTAGLRDRFVLGLPWGTLLTVAGLLVVYAVVQGGMQNPYDPLVLPFRSWGYDYLLGTLAAAFTHNGLSHLVNNVTSTIAFAGVAEYAWGHYPRRRGASTFASVRTNPYARILAVPAFAVAVGLLTSATGLGPLIGFSGVVFAFAGFALIQAPVAATLALVGVRILRLLVSTLQYPQQEVGIHPTVITPWWAEVAIQTHAVGLLAGLLAGIALAKHRGRWSNPLTVWFAVLVFAIVQGLWAVFLPLSSSRWLLLRWVGATLLFVLATLAAVGAYERDRRLFGRLDLHRRELAVGLLIVGLAAMALAAIPFHVAAVGEDPAPNAVLDVEGYSIGYGEDVPEGYVDAVDLPGAPIPTVPTSGVIVTNEERNLWRQALSTEELATEGRGSLLIGGLGWRERIFADWRGWKVAGNASVYKIYLARENGEWTQAYASNASRSNVVVAGYNLSVAPTSDAFTVTARTANRTVGPVAIPPNGTRTPLGPITLSRVERRLVAVHEDTRVPFATRTEQAVDENRTDLQ